MKKIKPFSALIKQCHLKVLRSHAYVLTLGTQDEWWGLVTVLAARLTIEERAALASMTLMSLDRHDAIIAADAALRAMGCAPIHIPALRWAAYVHNLRAMGVKIKTISEPHEGNFPGHLAPYVLRSGVSLGWNGGAA